MSLDHPPQAPYSLRNVQDMLPIARNVVLKLIDSGFVTPTRGRRNEYRFTFQDIVLLRTAHALQAADIAPRKIVQSLKQLRTTLPAQVPMSGLRISAVGNRVTVRERNSQWEADSGQLLMDFEVLAEGGSVSFLEQSPPSSPSPPDADALFAQAETLEAQDRDAAEAAYRQVLARSTHAHARAYINLGALLCEAGRCPEAVSLFDEALHRCPQDPTLHFNRAVALEDLHRVDEAIEGYHRCIELNPDFADAHYNLARLSQQAGDAQKALRHFNAYRRLAR